jgi:stage V sporulation protein G
MSCGCKNHLRARHCNQCGSKLDENRAMRGGDGRAKLHADIAHPINSTCREYIQTAIIKAFYEEKDRAKQPGYVCRYDDYDTDFEAESYTQIVAEMSAARKAQEGYRTDRPHATQGTHAPAEQETQEAAPRKRDFGTGIL